MSSATPPGPPVAAVRPERRSHHGHDFLDPYAWLRHKDDPDVIGYLEAENAWTDSRTAHLAGLREEIFTDIAARTRQTDLSVPTFRRHLDASGRARPYWYYRRTIEGREYPVFCRVPASDPSTPPDADAPAADEQVLLDGNVEADGQEFFALGGLTVSPDGQLLAWATDVKGDERYSLRIKDIETGRSTGDEVPDIGWGLAWAGNTHVFYTRADDAWRSYRILRHRLGDRAEHDALVWEEPDERYALHLGLSRDRRWLTLASGSKLTTEYRLVSTDRPEEDPRTVAPRREGVEYHVEPAGDRLFILHNDGAPDFELAQAPIEDVAHGQGEVGRWETVIPHEAGRRLTDVDAFADHVVVSLRRQGLPAVHVLPYTGSGFGAGRDVLVDEPLYSVFCDGWDEYATDRVRVSVTSLVTPETVYDYLMGSGELVLRKQTPVLDHPDHGPYRPADYVQVREWATAPDGTRVPISIVYRAGLELDGAAPALLYGYGSYEISMDPSFAISRLSLLDRGFVYAIAHIRGGGELGRRWYEEGRTTAKRNTFTDFIACAERLVAAGYTAADRLAAQGGSAGGLLMGAVANLAPEAFRAIHAAVPFVDALTTILNPDLPLTVTEWDEWGDPLHDAAVYDYLRSYTPYENVAAHPYPAILATTSLNDTRVYYTEPAKWVAALRVATRGFQPADRPILLKTEMVAGHGGVSGRYRRWRETAFELSWLIDQCLPTRPQAKPEEKDSPR